MLKLVPFNELWVTHNLLDMHAIYRRPARVEDEYGELIPARDPDGNAIWDLTSPLPIRQHNKWRAKGYEYVTLANCAGPEGGSHYLRMAAMTGTLIGGTPSDYSQDPRTGGPWNYRKYLDGQKTSRAEGLSQLEQDVTEFGSVAVERIRRQTDPGFTLPPHLRNRQPGDTAKATPKLEKVKH